MLPVGIVMAHRDVAVDAMQFSLLLFVVEMRFPSFLAQSQWKIVLVTVYAGRLKGVGTGGFDLRFCLPVQAFRVFKQLPVYITDPRPYFLRQVSFTIRREVAVHTMYPDPALIVIMRGELPALRGMGMNMTRLAELVGGSGHNGLAAEENDHCCHQDPAQKEEFTGVFSFPSHLQVRSTKENKFLDQISGSLPPDPYLKRFYSDQQQGRKKCGENDKETVDLFGKKPYQPNPQECTGRNGGDHQCIEKE